MERTRVLALAPAGGSELHRPLCVAGSLSMASAGFCCWCWLGSPTASRWLGLGLGGAPSCACGQSARVPAWCGQPASEAQSTRGGNTAAKAGSFSNAWASLRTGQASTVAKRAVQLPQRESAEQGPVSWLCSAVQQKGSQLVYYYRDTTASCASSQSSSYISLRRGPCTSVRRA